MPMTLRFPLPVATMLALLLLAACGDEPAAPPPPPVDPASLEVAAAGDDAIDPPEAHVADWTPALPALRTQDLKPTLRDAKVALAEGRLIATGWPAALPADADVDVDADDDAAAADDADADADPAADAAADADAPRWSGPDPGALEMYLAVLEHDPENAEAVAGVRAIADELLARGGRALVDGRVLDAQRFERIVTRALPTHPALAGYRVAVTAGQRARTLVARAEAHSRAGRVLEPEGRNALAELREALAAVPGYLPAQDALARLQRERLDAALVAAQQGEYARAERLHAEAGRILPGSSAWQDRGARLVELRQARTRELLAQGDAAVDALDLELAARRLAEAERVSVQAAGLDALAQRIELARHYGRFRPGQVFRDPLAAGGEAPEMVVLAHGRYTMGAGESDAQAQDNERPAHAVAFEHGFAIARAEVTVGEFAGFVADSGYRSVATRRGGASIYDERGGAMAARDGIDWRHDFAGRAAAPDLPVVHVAFEDAQAYAAWLSAQTGQRYRLPSEAEFEYALRGGREDAWPWGAAAATRVVGNLTGDGDRSRSGREWTNAIAGYADGHWGPAPVRSYPAEPFGTFDLVGNVSEWVLDCWHDSYRRAPADGSAWENPGCGERVVRGASWASTLDRARAAYRQPAEIDSRHARLGFRVVRDLQAPAAADAR